MKQIHQSRHTLFTRTITTFLNENKTHTAAHIDVKSI